MKRANSFLRFADNCRHSASTAASGNGARIALRVLAFQAATTPLKQLKP